MNDEKSISAMELFFFALADKTRLRLLNLMRRGELCVYYLVEVLGESQPKISRHLAVLRNSGIVEARRQGKWVHYKIIMPVNDLESQVLQNTLDWLNSQQVMRQDYEKLIAYCLSNSSSELVQMPIPNIFAESNMRKRIDKELEIFLL